VGSGEIWPLQKLHFSADNQTFVVVDHVGEMNPYAMIFGVKPAVGYFCEVRWNITKNVMFSPPTSVAEGIVFLSCPSTAFFILLFVRLFVCLFVHPDRVLPQYLMNALNSLIYTCVQNFISVISVCHCWEVHF